MNIKLIDHFISVLEKHLWWLSLTFFIAGIFLANQSTNFAYFINNLMENFIDSYSYVAPLAIYLILTPTLIKLFDSESRDGNFTSYTIKWFVVARLIACVYGVIFTSIAFGLPVYSSADGFIVALIESFKSLAWMLMHSTYFHAIYASIITLFIALKISKLARFLEKGIDLVEHLGKYIIPFIPFLMMAIGAYVTILPEVLEKSLGNDFTKVTVDVVSIFWCNVNIDSSLGMILLYVLAALLTGLCCGIWHAGLIILAMQKQKEFSLRNYFSIYWVKMYPMLWATSSEALATPLNLYMVKKLCPDISDQVRQFVVGTGSFLNINGTIINVFLMTGLVAAILDIDISMLQLFLAIPIVFLIGYGVPGIPGELVLFGGPVAICIGVPTELMTVFLGLYIGMQIGLPDSFRTASNSTDECLCAIILNEKFKSEADKVKSAKKKEIEA